MKELRKLSEDKDTFILNWEQSDLANEYIVEGITSVFTHVPVARTKKCYHFCNKDDKYVGYRVAYVVKNSENKGKRQEFVIDKTNIITCNSNVKPISIIAIKSANNCVSLSFRAEEHYDLYRLYNEKGKLVAETEDCITIGPYAGGQYYVEGYYYKDNNYVVGGLSDITLCNPVEFVSSANPTLSIVIPVYNCENFLPRTLQSILSSTFTDFEIVLVDDESNDSTKKLCDWYSDNFDCIRTIHAQKSPIGAVRNRCLQEANAEWVAFVDSDDIIHPYMYEKLFKSAKDLGTDIAIAQCIMRTDYNEHQLVLSANVNQNIIVMNSFKEVVEHKKNQRNLYFVAVWNKIVKTEVAKKVRFDENLLYYEDTAYTAPLYSYIDKFVLVKDAYYIWDKRKQKTEGTLSTSHPSRPSELVWLHYYLSYASSLVIGNPDKEIAAVYKYDILQHLLSKYIEKGWAKEIKNVMRGVLKYFVREFDLPIDRLKANKNDEKLYNAWLEIKESSIKEYNGIGDIPKEYYL